MRASRVGAAVLGLWLAVGAAWASQAPAHVYFALRAREQVSGNARAIIDSNLAAYLAGAAGPDTAYTAYYVQVGAGLHPAGTEGHKTRTGQLVANMFRHCQTDADRAFVLGWLTHWQVDNIIHPLVNRYGGYFGTDELHHKHLEMFESAHVFKKWAGNDNLDQYIADPAGLPAEVVNAAYAETYADGSNASSYRPWMMPQGQATYVEQPPQFIGALRSSAENMRILTEALVAQHRTGTYSGIWATGTMYLAVKGPPPTTEEYQRLMKPIVIDEVEWEEPDRAAGGQAGYIKVTYTINDVRLFKAFADDWDRVRPAVVSAVAGQINRWDANPAGFTVPDTDLDVGPAGYDPSERSLAWPGKPDLREMLAKVNVFDEKDQPVMVFDPGGSRPWAPEGEWVPCPPAEPQTWGQWLGLTSQVGTKEKVWGGNAGQAFFRVPVDATEPGEYRAELELALADKADRTPYGINATWSGPLGGLPELSILFLVDCSGSMGGGKLEAAKEAVRASVDQTNDGKTEWALVRFGSCSVTVVCGFTTVPNKLKAAVGTLGAGGDTPLMYARGKALHYLVSRGRGLQGRMVILCDGQDNCSEHGSASQEEASANLHQMMQMVQPAATTRGVSGGAR